MNRKLTIGLLAILFCFVLPGSVQAQEHENSEIILLPIEIIENALNQQELLAVKNPPMDCIFWDIPLYNIMGPEGGIFLIPGVYEVKPWILPGGTFPDIQGIFSAGGVIAFC